MSMVHSDNEIAEIYHNYEIKITNRFAEILINNGFGNDNLIEKVHIALGLIDNLCHEIIYHKHENMNYKNMIEIVIDTILYLI